MIDTVDWAISGDFGASCVGKRREEIGDVNDLIIHSTHGYFAWPANDEWRAKRGFHGSEIRATPRTTVALPRVRRLRAVVARENQDRVFFGKDAYSVPEYFTYFRLLETADEYFDPIRKYHGIWKLYGLDLPDDVLKKLYYKNALRMFPGLNPEGFPR